ncbi:ATP-binding cassette domain-containing protein [Paracoccus sp. YIM 132242]|uniref:ATP-binding cassette domain-containing protein n=1 Tax=Paracoccus lichenicola TaxID=2665644 RepID=A0A6L6HTH8_9RHOB|nr:ABC transporter ATP-binding protein [Paracoccus lichenicola]MTE01533.1 ATP-binding cassette domain-containing protein [Paracoccus lichenicola]
MSGLRLTISDLSSGHGQIRVLRDISFSVAEGEVSAIVGANGAGKTTLLSTIAGLIRPTGGRIVLGDRDITRLPAHVLPGLGLALVPEGGRLFPFMSVQDNLQLGAYGAVSRRESASRMEELIAIFPILGERRTQLAGRLSGGERQMCAVARALMSRPRFLMLDEPSVGLSPLMTEKVLDTVTALARRETLGVVIVEQRVTEALEVADTAHVLDHGRIVQSDRAEVLRNDRRIQETYMGL